jgi:hypothetical protein
LPFGAVSILGIIFSLQNPNRPDNGRSFKARVADIDYIGPLLFIPAISCLLLALQFGGTTNTWTSPKVWALLAVFIAVFPIWIFSQFWLGERATIPPRIFFQRTVFFGSCYSFFLGACEIVILFFVPLYFQGVRGLSALQSGINILPYVISSTVSAGLGGVAMSFIGYVMPFMVAGGVLLTIGCGLLTLLSVETSTIAGIMFQILVGIGIGMNLNVSL